LILCETETESLDARHGVAFQTKRWAVTERAQGELPLEL
jgi:hypothetical protein